MACNSCKKNTEDTIQKVSIPKNILVRVFIFLLTSVILVPLIIPILLITLFRVIILSKNVDVLPLAYFLGKKIFPDEEEEEDDEEEDDEETEYELEDEIIEFK